MAAEQPLNTQSMSVLALTDFFSHLQSQLASASDEVRRLFHGRGCAWPGLEQLTCDWVAGQLIVTLYKEVDEAFVSALSAGLQSVCAQYACVQAILLQHRYTNGAPSYCLQGELNAAPIVSEHGLKYQLDIGRNQNFGLFLDMRYGRQWVRQHATGKVVLNLFAYTCGFSVAALAGGASKVVNVDMAKASLNKGRINHRLNEQDLSRVHFLGHDIFKSWGKIGKSGPYDLIIIDPPSFQKGSFALHKDYAKILRRLSGLLSEQGEVLACVNSPAVSSGFILQGMAEHAPDLKFVERLANPPEFAEVDAERGLKVMRFTR